MADPLQGVYRSDSVGAAPAAQTGAPPSVTNTDAAPASSDSANVSSTTTLLAAITKAADSVPTIDETRVTALQQAIASGTFQPDSEQTAQKMIDMEGLLDGGKATA